jgi:hypothetical protein
VKSNFAGGIMANVIYYRIQKSTKPPQCGPHGPDQEGIALDETLKAIDPNKDGKLGRDETQFNEDQFEKIAEKVAGFRRALGDCSIKYGATYLHQDRLEIVKVLGMSCSDKKQHHCVSRKATTNTTLMSKDFKGLQYLLKKFSRDSRIENTYANNPEKYTAITQAGNEIQKYLRGKEKAPFVAKRLIVAWLRNHVLRNDDVSTFYRLKLIQLLGKAHYRDVAHKRGGRILLRALRANYAVRRKRVRAVDASTALSVATAGVHTLDDIEFKLLPQTVKPVRVDSVAHFVQTYRSLVEESLVLSGKVSEMSLTLHVKIHPPSGNIIYIAFKNIKVRGYVSRIQKQRFTLAFIELADRLRNAYRFFPEKTSTIVRTLRLVRR